MTKNLSTKNDVVNAKKLFEKWCADLKDRARSKDHLFENFDDLFFEFKRHAIEHDVAYEYVRHAVAKHLPDKYVLRRTYHNSESKKYQTESEFAEAWEELIKSAGVQAFYNNYPIKEEAAATGKQKIQLPTGMSREEYSRQRKHAMQFPIIDLDSIESAYNKANEEKIDPSSINFDDILGDS